jgi:hypothetical protein
MTKNVVNVLYLNINNNSRKDFDTYTLEFIHVMSKERKVYVIDLNNPTEYFSNIRYCTITLDLSTDDLNYEGQYVLNIVGSGNGNNPENVFKGMMVLDGLAESHPFTEYISPNETNENYIYIQE